MYELVLVHTSGVHLLDLHTPAIGSQFISFNFS